MPRLSHRSFGSMGAPHPLAEKPVPMDYQVLLAEIDAHQTYLAQPATYAQMEERVARRIRLMHLVSSRDAWDQTVAERTRLVCRGCDRPAASLVGSRCPDCNAGANGCTSADTARRTALLGVLSVVHA